MGGGDYVCPSIKNQVDSAIPWPWLQEEFVPHMLIQTLSHLFWPTGS